MGDATDDTTPPASLREDDGDSSTATLLPHPETTELPDHFPRSGDGCEPGEVSPPLWVICMSALGPLYHAFSMLTAV